MSAIRPRTSTVVIYQGDDMGRLAELDRAVERASDELERLTKQARDGQDPPRLMSQADPVAEARSNYDAAVAARDEFAAEAGPRGVKVAMHALPRRKWRELMKEHGPRDGVIEDKPLGVNLETLPDALLPLSVCRDATCPSCSTSEGRSTIKGDTVDFLESLSDYDYYDRLFMEAFALNRGSAVADPTQRLGSMPSQTSAATSS